MFYLFLCADKQASKTELKKFYFNLDKLTIFTFSRLYLH